MIQIQDDPVNQVVSPPVNSAGQMYQQLIQKDQSISPLQSAQSTVDERENNNAAEIDKLLAELDKLSKNLEEKPVAPAPVQAQTASPVQATDSIPQKTEPAAKEDQLGEKFDFDSFLSDLEKKIDQESDKNKVAEPSEPADAVLPQSEEDFRKNRPALDLQDDVEEVKESEESLTAKNDSEELKSQNIFEMLGLMNISDSEKNQFLDELETMIWDDFIFHDLELLLTSEEYAEARDILDNKDKKEDEKKEALIIYLEKLIPDLDEVLYEKALELKSEMMGERLAKMKEGVDETVLAKVKEAESLISQNRWRSAASLLNQLS